MNGVVINNRYKIRDTIGRGAFGELRRAEDMVNKSIVAVKLEPFDSRQETPPLLLEYKCYKMINQFDGIPRVYYYGRIGKYNAMVMELFGKNLETVFSENGRQFTLKTIIYIFIQLLQRIEHIHKSYLVFRDIKPENFVMGLEGTPKENIIYIIDFGLAKQYYNPLTQRHIPMTDNQPMIGMVRYMSINAHLGKEQSRRDDLEAIGYMMMYFLRQGKLPWSGLTYNTQKERFTKIGLFKRGTPIETLCYGFKEAFADYLRYVRQLEFEETPDYYFLKMLFRKLFEKEKFVDDGYYDWCPK